MSCVTPYACATCAACGMWHTRTYKTRLQASIHLPSFFHVVSSSSPVALRSVLPKRLSTHEALCAKSEGTELRTNSSATCDDRTHSDHTLKSIANETTVPTIRLNFFAMPDESPFHSESGYHRLPGGFLDLPLTTVPPGSTVASTCNMRVSTATPGLHLSCIALCPSPPSPQNLRHQRHNLGSITMPKKSTLTRHAPHDDPEQIFGNSVHFHELLRATLAKLRGAFQDSNQLWHPRRMVAYNIAR
eukprot:COSAG01_NODE_1147_length_11515_cov_38.979694_13_plen_245_part_00